MLSLFKKLFNNKEEEKFKQIKTKVMADMHIVEANKEKTKRLVQEIVDINNEINLRSKQNVG